MQVQAAIMMAFACALAAAPLRAQTTCEPASCPPENWGLYQSQQFKQPIFQSKNSSAPEFAETPLVESNPQFQPATCGPVFQQGAEIDSNRLQLCRSSGFQTPPCFAQPIYPQPPYSTPYSPTPYCKPICHPPDFCPSVFLPEFLCEYPGNSTDHGTAR